MAVYSVSEQYVYAQGARIWWTSVLRDSRPVPGLTTTIIGVGTGDITGPRTGRCSAQGSLIDLRNAEQVAPVEAGVLLAFAAHRADRHVAEANRAERLHDGSATVEEYEAELARLREELAEAEDTENYFCELSRAHGCESEDYGAHYSGCADAACARTEWLIGEVNETRRKLRRARGARKG